MLNGINGHQQRDSWYCYEGREEDHGDFTPYKGYFDAVIGLCTHFSVGSKHTHFSEGSKHTHFNVGSKQ